MIARTPCTPRTRRLERPFVEEIANSVTHGIGAGLSIVALVVLVVLAAMKGDPWRIVAFSIYGGTLVILYLASTLYHGSPWPNVKRFFRKVDHACIYLLIAGTYTPFMLISMRNAWGWTIFGLVWGVALFGVLFKFFCIGRFEVLATASYVLMGWICVIAIRPLLDHIPMGAIWWMLAGGICYTVGVIFYALHRLPFSHTIWHGFVIGGSVLQFFAILLFLLPE